MSMHLSAFQPHSSSSGKLLGGITSPSQLQRSVLNCSRSSLLDDSFSQSQLATKSQPGVSVANASFLGSGISDLRATVLSQQKSLDGMAARLAALLKSMHDELVRELRTSTNRDMTKVTEHVQQESARLSSVVDGRLQLVQDQQQDWLQAEAERFKLRMKEELQLLQRDHQHKRDLEGELHHRDWQRELQKELQKELQNELQRDLHQQLRQQLSEELQPALFQKLNQELQSQLQSQFQVARQEAQAQAEEEQEQREEQLSSIVTELNGSLGGLREEQDTLRAELQQLQEGLVDQLHQLQDRLSRAEAHLTAVTEMDLVDRPALEEILTHRLGEACEEGHLKAMEEVEPVFERLEALEQQSFLQGTQSERAALEVQAAAKRQHQRLEKLENLSTATSSALQGLEAAISEVQTNCGELRQESQEQLAVGEALEGRLQQALTSLPSLAALEEKVCDIEDWRKRADSRLERIPAKVDGCREQLLELKEQTEASLSGLQRETRRTAQRVEDFAQGTGAAGFGDDRVAGQRSRQDLELVSCRVEHLEQLVQDLRAGRSVSDRTPASPAPGGQQQQQHLQQQHLQQQQQQQPYPPYPSYPYPPYPYPPQTPVAASPSPLRLELSNRVETELSQMQTHLTQLSDELWQTLATQNSKHQSSLERLADELRSEFRQRHSLSEYQELQQDLRTRLADVQQACQRPLEELRKSVEEKDAANASKIDHLQRELQASERRVQDLRKDFTDSTDRANSLAKQTSEDLKRSRSDALDQMEELRRAIPSEKSIYEGLEGIIAERFAQLQASHQRALKELRREVASAKATGNDVKNELREFRGTLSDVRSVAIESAKQVSELPAEFLQELAIDAVSSLGTQLEERLRDRLSRCDAAAAGCERCARAVEERLRLVTEDLRHQLERDSAGLMEMAAQEQVLLASQGSPSTTQHHGVGLPLPEGWNTAAGAAARLTMSNSVDLSQMPPPGSPSGLLAALSGRVAQQETTMQSLQRENARLREAAGQK